MLDNNDAFKYELEYKGTFEITRCWTNGVVTLYCGEIKIRYNIRRIEPYTSDTNVEYIKFQELIIVDVTLGKYQLYTTVLY